MTGVIHEWRRLSQQFADANNRACAAAEEAKAAIHAGAERGVACSPLTVAKFQKAVDLLDQARQLMSQLIEVHTKLFPYDQKIFEVEAMVETSVQRLEACRDKLLHRA